jgi:hypothetical protein
LSKLLFSESGRLRGTVRRKYLTLIDTIAFLHQHQRPVKTDAETGMRYIEATDGDVAIANRLSAKVLASTVDELAPQTRHLHGLVDALVSERAKREGIDRSDVRFTRRDVRDFTRRGDTQLKVHLKRLEELEYLVVHAGGARRRMVYELAVGAESHAYDQNWSGGGDRWSGLRCTGIPRCV